LKPLSLDFGILHRSIAYILEAFADVTEMLRQLTLGLLASSVLES